MIILGMSGTFRFGSESASCALLIDGEVVGACEEERFTRIKYGRGCVPVRAMTYLLNANELSLGDIDVFTYHVDTYSGFEEELIRFLKNQYRYLPRKILATNHHLAHGANAFWGSGFSEAAVITNDYAGDGLCGGLYYGKENQLNTIETISSKGGKSLGKYYAAFTQFLGFERGDEYKVMGLAAYGESSKLYDFDSVIKVSETDYTINPKIYFDGPSMTFQQFVFSDDYLDQLGLPRRKPGSPVTDEHKNLAFTVQYWFEKAMLALARRIKEKTNARYLAVAGGCGCNTVANRALQKSKIFEKVYIPSAPSDAGNALGGAYLAAAEAGQKVSPQVSAYLGPSYDNKEIRLWLDRLQVKGVYIENVTERAAKDIAGSKLVGWFQGRSEFGPRALGSRSILANPCDPSMKDKINR
ncbi:carbamoyltransferase N-terminal domain-containing protein, partial [Nitrospinaceae bacterium]|nr:carbamoyltransferase N-terminal domain-containing protein [Nitrospinaceae bacterium]